MCILAVNYSSKIEHARIAHVIAEKLFELDNSLRMPYDELFVKKRLDIIIGLSLNSLIYLKM